VPVAAADLVAERPALVREAAARARGRQHLGLDEQSAHQGRPQGEVQDQDRAAHSLLIGREHPKVYPRVRFAKIGTVSWLYIALLALAVAIVVGAEWPRLESRFGKRVRADARRKRDRAKRKESLRLVHTDADDFAASVERDLAQLPTIEETDHRKN
jgi:hypothetical protein